MTFPLDHPADGLDKPFRGDERIRTAESVLTTESNKAPHEGVVYVFQAESGGPVKIGYCETSKAVKSRLRTIQTGNPAKLRIVHLEDGPRSREIDLHHTFERYRLVGEWFTPSHRIAERFPNVIHDHEDVTPLSTMYDLGFQDGWERGYDDGTPCDLCGERALCECPETPEGVAREDKIQTSLARHRYYALHGSTRGLCCRRDRPT